MFKHVIHHSSSTPSKEAFSFSSPKGASPLFTGLTEICQSMLDAVNSPTSLSVDEASKQIADAAKKLNFSAKIKELVKKCANLKLRSVTLDPEAMFNATMVTFLDHRKASREFHPVDKSVGRDTVGGYFQTLATTSVHQDEYGNIELPDNMQKVYICELHISDSWFMSKTFYHDEPITADMIAAVILHEIGHAISLYKDYARISSYNDIANDLISYSRRDLTVDDATKLLDDLAVMIKESFDGAKEHSLGKAELHDATSQYLIDGINGLREKLTKANKVDRDSQAGIRYIASLASWYIISCMGLSSETLAEIYETDHTSTHNERLADEYAVRNGAGTSLAKSFKLMHTLDEQHRIAGSYQTLKKIPLISNFVSLMQYMKLASDLEPCMVNGAYDPINKRLDQLIKSANMALKDTKMSPEGKDYYVKQIKSCQQVIDQYTNQSHVKARNALFSIARTVGKISFLPLVLMLKSTGAQYEALQEWTDDLIRNNIAYQNARVEKVLENSY